MLLLIKLSTNQRKAIRKVFFALQIDYPESNVIEARIRYLQANILDTGTTSEGPSK
jgi:hypothetical protein